MKNIIIITSYKSIILNGTKKRIGEGFDNLIRFWSELTSHTGVDRIYDHLEHKYKSNNLHELKNIRSESTSLWEYGAIFNRNTNSRYQFMNRGQYESLIAALIKDVCENKENMDDCEEILILLHNSDVSSNSDPRILRETRFGNPNISILHSKVGNDDIKQRCKIAGFTHETMFSLYRQIHKFANSDQTELDIDNLWLDIAEDVRILEN